MLAASDESIMVNKRGNDIHSRLSILSVMCHNLKDIADVSYKGRVSRTDTVLEEENREIGWAVIS